MNSEKQPPHDDFEDQFRQKFDEWEAPAPEWSAFRVHIPVAEPTKKTRFKWHWTLLLALCLCFLDSQKPSHIIGKGRQGAGMLEKPNTQDSNHQNRLQTQNKEGQFDKNTISTQNTLTHKSGQKNLPTQTLHALDVVRQSLPTQTHSDNTQTPIVRQSLPTQTRIDSTKTLTTIDVVARQSLPTQTHIDSTQKTLPTTQAKPYDSISRKSIVIEPIMPVFASRFAEKEQPFEPKAIADSLKPIIIPQIVGNKWCLQASFSPLYSYKIVQPNVNDDIYIHNFEASKGFASQNFGYAINLKIERNLTQKWSVYAGAMYQLTRLQLQYSYRNTKPSDYTINTHTAYKVVFTPNFETNSVQKQALVYQSLALETGVGYKLSQNRFSQTFHAGIAYQRVLEVNLTNVPRGHLIFQTDVCLAYKITPRFQLSVSPFVRYNASQVLKSPYLSNFKNYHTGLQIGMGIGF